jgi:PhnB protein
MKLVNNLVFKGDCRPAFELYAKILGGEITAMFAFGDAPGGMPVDETSKGLIMHAWLQIGDQALMGCDAPKAYEQDMGGFSVAFHTDDAAEARRVFDALAEGGTTRMPFGPTFWSPAFGGLVDRFGTPWMINTTPAEGWTPTPA